MMEALRNFLLALRPTGHQCFEGLMAAVLGEIIGIPFRLASSGTQRGIDGANVSFREEIGFEAKLYDGSIQKDKVVTKITETALYRPETDLWILCATTEVSAQLAEEVMLVGKQNGIPTLVLDWTASGLPQLAVCLGLAIESVDSFIANIEMEGHRREVRAALVEVGKDANFQKNAEEIKAHLNVPSYSHALALQHNTTWLEKVFADSREARNFLGQPLAPRELSAVKVLERKSLREQWDKFLESPECSSALVITGKEGNGKSWFMAQSWLAMKDRPLMVIIRPEMLSEHDCENDFQKILVTQLLRQTNEEVTELAEKRWSRKLGLWRKSTEISLTIVMVIDGLNQRPRTDWGRIMDRFSAELDKLGGKLVVTTRTPYFRDMVKNRMFASTQELNVPEWLEVERNEILAAKHIDSKELNEDVAKSLLNPRLLAIALQLLDSAEIGVLEELSVSRLLFEHMRNSEKDSSVPRPAREFARQLSHHAEEVVNRVESNAMDDLMVFRKEIESVVDGRFFQDVAGDPGSYTIEENGLDLALAFSVISKLSRALRNNHDVDAELRKILEPVEALDRTAKVVQAAVTISAIDEDCSIEVGAALIYALAELQNIDDTDFDAFSSLAVKRIGLFLCAAKSLCLAEGNQQNYDWVELALLKARAIEAVWDEIRTTISYWFRKHSLSPELGMMKHRNRDSEEEVEKELGKNKKRLEEKLNSLSDHERKMLEYLQEESGDLNKLTLLAIKLLAGKPLQPFAKDFLFWCFSNALNSDYWGPRDQLRQLCRFNLVDWEETRNALLLEAGIFEQEATSITGKWAHVAILHLTGDSEDASKAEILVNEIRVHPIIPGWRLVEKYCATDPCDPNSVRPENILETEEKYKNIDVAKLNIQMGVTQEDHFFDYAKLGLARFSPAVVINKHRELAEQTLARSGFPLRQALLEISRHTSVVSRELAKKYADRYGKIDEEELFRDVPENSGWISEYFLRVAFPFMSAEEQIDMLIKTKLENPSLQLMRLCQSLSSEAFDRRIQVALEESNEANQFILLSFALETNTPISDKSTAVVSELLDSCSERLHAQLLGIVANLEDRLLVKKVINCNWADFSDYDQRGWLGWFGSYIVFKAVNFGFVDIDEALKRVSPMYFRLALSTLEDQYIGEISRRVDASFQKLLGLESSLVLPDVEMNNETSNPLQRVRYNLHDRVPEPKDIRELFERFGEGIEEFNHRQQRLQKSFEEFRAELSRSKAMVILDRFERNGFKRMVEADWGLALKWHGQFMSLNDKDIPLRYNLIVLLAYSFISNGDFDKGLALFRKVRFHNPAIQFTEGMARVGVEAMVLWSVPENAELKTLLENRLDAALNDHALALEVLAAEWNGRSSFIEKYVCNKLSMVEPAEVSRGIMVAGFSDGDTFEKLVSSQYAESAGFVKQTFDAAKYAQERNRWARHWYKQMSETDKPEDFWRYSQLFAKVVDGRFEIWRNEVEGSGQPISLFWPSVGAEVRNRVEKWEKKRKDKLFGQKAPMPLFTMRAADMDPVEALRHE